MKLKVPKSILDYVRQAITGRREHIAENRDKRKLLIREIRALKTNIKHGENLCSKLEVGLIVDTAYIRTDLRKKRELLDKLRQDLLAAEIDHSVAKAVCRSLHEQLDRLNAPFDPEKAKTSGRK